LVAHVVAVGIIQYFEVVDIDHEQGELLLLALGALPLWITALTALTVQTSFLMPPSGFALFFLRSIAHREVTTRDIYRGVLPFIVIQLFAIALLWRFPELATALPALLD